MFEFLIVALAQAAAGEPQTAASQTARQIQPVAPDSLIEAAAEDRIVCFRVLRTGSRILQRRCLTAREQEEIRTGARAAVEAAQRIGLIRH